MRCAIYSRVSTRDRGQDVENQLIQLREFAATQGWEVYREYVDQKSGGTSDRDEFQALFQDVSQRKFDVAFSGHSTDSAGRVLLRHWAI